MIHPTVIKESGTKLYISGEQYEQLVKEPQAVLWNRDGMYALVPLARVKNAIYVLNDGNKYRETMNWAPRKTLVFSWGETLEIPVETGRALERDG